MRLNVEASSSSLLIEDNLVSISEWYEHYGVRVANNAAAPFVHFQFALYYYGIWSTIYPCRSCQIDRLKVPMNRYKIGWRNVHSHESNFAIHQSA
jgi:hypothetical protein